MKIKNIILGLLVLVSNFIYAQSCATNDSWEWPSHRNWFTAAPAGWTGLITNMSTFATTSVGAVGGAGPPGGAITSYEGVATVSDDNGNLLWYTNGRKLWTGTGTTATLMYSGLLSGNEDGATGFNGSAVQGIMVVKHPLSPEDYYIFTSDDANSGSKNGLNYWVVDASGTVQSGPTRIGAFTTTEGIAVTRHANGLDLWIGVMESGTGEFNAILLTCSGVDLANSNMGQAGAPNVSGQQDRGSIAFSHDGTRFAQAHPNGWPTADQQVSVYDFDNSTGAFSNPLHIAPTGTILAPYDVTFSPDDSRLYISRQNAGIDYFDLSSGVAATITSSRSATGVSTGFSALEIGPGPTLYTTTGTNSSAIRAITPTNGDLNTATTFSVANVPGTNGNARSGLPIMFLPPTDEPEIQGAGPYCDTDAPVDLSTNWACLGTNAETFAHTYSGPGITDANAGTFDPSVAGVGVHEIIFSLNGTCNLIDDTLFITVNSCGACLDTTLSNAINDVCVDQTADLSTYEVTSDPGTWSIVSTPGGSNPATITGGSTFDASNADAGTYRIRFTLDGGPYVNCPDSAERNIVVNPLPSVSISGGPICQGDSATLDAGNPGATYAWSPSGNTDQTEVVYTAGPHQVIVTLPTGCIDSASTTVTVNANPNVNITAPSASCDNEASEALSATPSGGTWYINDVISVSGQFDPGALGAGNHEIKYEVTDGNGCSDVDSINVTINAAPVVANLPGFSPICDNESVQTMTATPVGGNWYIDGVSSTDQFDPGALGAGNYLVKYSYTDGNSCSDSDSVSITVNAAPSVSIDPIGVTCTNQAVETLSATPVGGQWYINDVASTDQFDPNAVGAGNHEVKYAIVDANGCSDSDSVSVTINAAPVVANLPGFSPICENESVQTMTATPVGGNWYIDGVSSTDQFDPGALGAGNYLVKYSYTDGNSCSDSDSVSITVNAAPSVSIDPIGVTCTNQAVETLSATPIGGQWYINDVASTDQFDPNAVGAGNHEVKYAIVDANGCSDSDSVSVTINAAPNVGLLVTGAICENAAATTFLGNPIGGQWYVNDSATSDTFSPSNGVIGNNEVKYSYTDVNGCSDSDSVTMVINAAPVAAITSSNAVWCENDSLTLTGTPSSGVDYSWSQNGASGTADTSRVAGTGPFQLVVQDQGNGCYDTATVSFTAYLPSPNLGSDDSVCTNFSTILDPGNFASYLWDDGSTNSTRSITVGFGVYWVEVTDQGCTNRDSITFDQKIPFTVDLAGDTVICENSTSTLTATTNPAANNPSYSWTGGISTSNSATVSSAGQIKVIVSDNYNCIDSASVNISVNPLPVVSFPADTDSFCSLGQETITVKLWVDGDSTYQSVGNYNFTGGNFIENTATYSYAPTLVVGTYTDTNSCTNSDTVQLMEFCEPTIINLPNIFVPGGNGTNATFRPIDMTDENFIELINNIVSSDFQVFNRWGLKVFQSENVIPNWDGLYENRPVASGTYFWVYKYKDSSLREYYLNGFVQVVQQRD